VYRGNDDVINGFNFDIDRAVWKHKVIFDKDRFYIGIMMPDGEYHSFHGVNENGNVATLLYVHGNENAKREDADKGLTIADLMERFIRAELSFDEVLAFVETHEVKYAKGATMQGMISDKRGRVLIIEPGLGFKEEESPKRYSLMTNYSLLRPESTSAFLTPGDDRYERAKVLLDERTGDFSVSDAFSVLKAVRQEGVWATRVTFVYSEREHSVYCVENNRFGKIEKFAFPEP
jgi:hypothetical protein